MKDFDGVILFIVGSFVVCALFFALVTGLKKAFRVVPKRARPDYSEAMREQKERMAETRRKQEQNRIDMRQKMQDYRNRTR